MVGISGSGKVAAVSVMMSGLYMTLYVAPSIDPVPSLFWQICRMILFQGQKYSLLSQCTGPGSQSRFQALCLVYFEVSYLCTSWD